MDWSNKNVLVTGAGGFIGSHLTERLTKLGARTRALVRYNSRDSRGWLENSPQQAEVKFFSGDIRDAAYVREAMEGVDVVFHLAALIAIPYSYHAPASYVETNITGTLNVLQAARELATPRVLVTSTSEVYGTALEVPIRESHPLQGQSPYAATKIAADKLTESYHLSFALPVVTVRPFNTFGPRQSARAVIPAIISQVMAGRELKLGNLTPTRDLNYVANTVDGYLAAAVSEKAVGQVINFGSGREISIGELALLVMRVIGREVTIQQDTQRLRPEKSEVQRLLADNSRAHDLLGWQPQVALE
ncbi:MAG: SDR family NAD(P)-dependent oxidoreductase, partial [Roseimicrobium sp.]